MNATADTTATDSELITAAIAALEAALPAIIRHGADNDKVALILATGHLREVRDAIPD